MKHLISLVLLVSTVFWLNTVHLSAQETLQSGTEVNIPAESGQEEKLPEAGAWKGFLDSIDQALSREGLDDAQLDEFYDEARRIIQEADTRILELQPQVASMQQQLDEIGPKPETGEPAEAEDVSNQRKSLNTQFAELDGELKEAKLALVRARQIQANVAGERRKRFVNSISSRSGAALSPEFWGRFFSGFTGYSKSLRLLFKDSFAILLSKLNTDIWKKPVLPALIAAALLMLLNTRRLLARIAGSVDLSGIDAQADKPLQALIEYGRNGLLMALVPLAIYLILSWLGLLTPRFDQFTGQLAASLAYLIAVISLVRVILSPGDASKRIARLEDPAATRIFRLLAGAVCMAAFLRILNNTSEILVSPFEVSFGLSFWFSLLVPGAAIAALMITSREVVNPSSTQGIRTRFVSWYYFKIIAWLIALVTIFSAILGYVALAEFLSLQLIFGALVIGTLWLVLRVLESLYEYTLMTAMPASGDIHTQSTGIVSRKQLGVVGFGFLKLVVYVVAGLLLLLPWGYRTSDFYEMVNQAFFGFKIGGLNISISTIMLALALFVVGYVITVAVRNWLNERLLPTTKLDIGLSNSISTIFGYIGFVLAAVLAISAAGFDLSNLAIVAGALSLGIGFGLQSIVNNFVSGLILLAERPIKAGDWVLTTGGEGTVKRISVRSTEIETFDRATIIVPNSTLITDPVTNWTHTSKFGRIRIKIGVGYDSDPDKVREILLNCAGDRAGILRKPEPVVYLMDFGSSSLDFELRVFLADINYCIIVSSELRFDILRALRKANIEIPFPQRDIHLKSTDFALMSAPPDSRR